jgi:hypothetical protein
MEQQIPSAEKDLLRSNRPSLVRIQTNWLLSFLLEPRPPLRPFPLLRDRAEHSDIPVRTGLGNVLQLQQIDSGGKHCGCHNCYSWRGWDNQGIFRPRMVLASVLAAFQDILPHWIHVPLTSGHSKKAL